jgi:hypothetical protein
MDAPRCIVCSTLAALIFAATSTAQAQNEPLRTGITPATGGLSCGRWTNTPKRSHEREVFTKWVLGFLSGVNIESEGSDFLKSMDVDALTAWVDNYCRANPLHGITEAMVELVKVLRAAR